MLKKRGGRKYPYEVYPREVKAFRRMQYRCQQGYTDCYWSSTARGFAAFIKCVGRIPRNIPDPSLGRRDHKKGYRPGNCFWQDRRENNGEPWSRPEMKAINAERVKRLFTRRTKARYAAMIRNRPGMIVWTPARRKAASERMKGNKIAARKKG